jgi:hypothetical protein
MDITTTVGATMTGSSTYYVGFEAAGQHIGLVPGGNVLGLLQDP